MNILIPHSWLKEFLTTSATPQKIADCLSLCSASVEKLNKVDGDWIYEIEITTNRVDMMSVVGIAREAAVILPQFNIKAKFKNPFSQITNYKLQITNKISNSKISSKLKVIIRDKTLCPRFAAVVLENIQIKPSPKIIQERLEKSGIRAINNVIDISNYLMRAFGQPVHIFDYEQIRGQKMVLRRSRPGEEITTLDGKTFKLPGDDIVIEDGEGRLIDLCGIMGGQNSAVTDKTKNILLFVQTYKLVYIRRTAIKLAQRTEAAQLFEKGTDPELVMPTLIKGMELIKKLANGKPASKIYDLYPKPYEPKHLKVNLNFINERLGVTLTTKVINKILKNLGFSPQYSILNTQYSIQTPSWRINDINIPEDIIEEVVRIYGYHNLPSILPTGKLSSPSPFSQNFYWEERVKNLLKGWGWTEVYTYSLQSEEQIKNFGLNPQDHLKLKNPLSSEMIYLRQTLIPSLLTVIAANLNFQKEIKIFELSNIYIPRKHELPAESLSLVLACTGEKFFTLKGICEALLAEFGVSEDFTLKIKPLNPQTTTTFGIKEKIIVAEIDFQQLIDLAKKAKIYQPISKFPPIIEDLTFIFASPVSYARVIELIRKSSQLINKIELAGQYQDKKTFRIYYRHPDKSLTDEDVRHIRKAIVANLEKEGLKLVGQV